MDNKTQVCRPYTLARKETLDGMAEGILAQQQAAVEIAFFILWQTFG